MKSNLAYVAKSAVPLKIEVFRTFYFVVVPGALITVSFGVVVHSSAILLVTVEVSFVSVAIAEVENSCICILVNFKTIFG